MVNEFNFIRLEEVLSRIMRHPLMKDLSYEDGIQYTVDFLQTVGFPKMFISKQACIEIEEFRAVLPPDLVQIEQIKNNQDNTYLKSMSSNIFDRDTNTQTYKVQGNILFTSFKEGHLDVFYKAIPIDDDNTPLIPDHPIFLKALELYIKKEWFTILFDLGKINHQILSNTQQEYAFKVAQCTNMFIIPSVSEMETITNMLNRALHSNKHFDQGFKNLSTR